VRRQVAGVDGADAGARQDVYARGGAANPGELVEDVSKDTDLVRAAGTASGEDDRQATVLKLGRRLGHGAGLIDGVGAGVTSKRAASVGLRAKRERRRGSRIVDMSVVP
jgi:hypothetical protein